MGSVTLRVAGRDYLGWQAVRVTRGMETLCGSFELGVSERWQNQDQVWPIGEGDPCVVLIEGVPLITGFIDTRELSYDATTHSVSVSGRDKAGELVDCSANPGLGTLHAKWEFKGISLLQFAQKICAPFGISVSLQSGLVLPPPPLKFSIDPGDTAFNALEQACRQAAVLPVSDGQGGVVLTRSSKLRAASSLVEGKNILSARARFDNSGRYRTYYVLGQHRGTDEDFGEKVAAISAKAEDLNVVRSERVLLVRPENGVTAAQAKKRAEWEATTRAARADQVSITVQGWTQIDGSVWPINALVNVRSPQIAIDGDMLITQASYLLDVSGGTRTELTLQRPEAFLPAPLIPKTDNTWKEIAKGV